jgi:hypothetical protein
MDNNPNNNNHNNKNSINNSNNSNDHNNTINNNPTKIRNNKILIKYKNKYKYQVNMIKEVTIDSKITNNKILSN